MDLRGRILFRLFFSLVVGAVPALQEIIYEQDLS